MKTKFYITQILDTRKFGSDIEYNKIFTGDYSHDKKKVFYTDGANCEWCFWIDNTCRIIKHSFESKKEIINYIKKLPKKLEIMIIKSADKYYLESLDAFVRTCEVVLYKGMKDEFNPSKI